MRLLFAISSAIVLSACATGPTATTTAANSPVAAETRVPAGDNNKNGRTHQLFGDCTLQTINRALDWGLTPNTYPQFDFQANDEFENPQSFDMPNFSLNGPKGITKMQVIFLSRIAMKDSPNAAAKQKRKGQRTDLDAFQFLLDDGESREDCKIVELNDTTKGLDVTKALSLRTEKSHAYFQDPCAVAVLNEGLRYFSKNNPHETIWAGEKSKVRPDAIQVRQSFRGKSSKFDEVIVLNLEVDDGDRDYLPAQVRASVDKVGDSCKIRKFEVRDGWTEVNLN